MKNDIVIIEGRRTPFVRSNGRFANHSNLELAIHSVNALLNSTPLPPEKVDTLIYGHVVLDPRVPQLAREIALQTPLSASTRAVSLNDNCISALSAAEYGVWTLQNTNAKYAIIGGVESMSNPALGFKDSARRIFMKANKAKTFGERLKIFAKLRPHHFAPQAPGVKEPSTGKSMGEHCEEMVKQWKISREAQDQWAFESQQKAAYATEVGSLKEEIAPLDGLTFDDTIRGDTTLAKLAKLRPSFDKSSAGSITAGSSSPLTDGAASVLMATRETAEADGLKSLAIIKDMEFAAIEPDEGLLMAPALAVPRLLARNNLTLNDIDLIEIHEAFAGQVLCNLAAWENGWKEPAIGKADRSKININGGSIALGHPFAATGARILTTLAHELARQNKQYGLISICGAGATAGAFLLEKA
ncbi:acetyl-CoA C-acyltransferase [Suttonella ornithocola]|uniref:3-ketoacyl-CoA thiolase n=1 Tax=Suttonella ornithocola TaxID=279832 RepID=A0A380MUE8_9GAMM|nr:acetyl-CoA C-acyltransferase [Suttonella ornithocola]SUO95908.1 3-ketoacyl-CoA thiolase [Suttonella ornithocola]